LAANSARITAELRIAKGSAEGSPQGLRHSEPPLAKATPCRIEVSELATQRTAKLRIAKGSAKTCADRLSKLARNVSEPAGRHVLLRRSVIGMRSTMPVRNLVRIS